MARARKLHSFAKVIKKRRVHHMVSAACLASLKYGGNVHGSNNTQLRTARAMQAYVQVNSLAGRSITLLLMLAEAP
eukprot:5298196-Pyramimonas_sp.AAC.1